MKTVAGFGLLLLFVGLIGAFQYIVGTRIIGYPLPEKYYDTPNYGFPTPAGTGRALLIVTFSTALPLFVYSSVLIVVLGGISWTALKPVTTSLYGSVPGVLLSVYICYKVGSSIDFPPSMFGGHILRLKTKSLALTANIVFIAGFFSGSVIGFLSGLALSPPTGYVYWGVAVGSFLGLVVSFTVFDWYVAVNWESKLVEPDESE